ncbi:MAG: hypothetical protein HOU01_26915, partial [Streptomycetaceae bacterium]|nr:hypothetical protein [Streptomycetaceae bacterium]
MAKPNTPALTGTAWIESRERYAWETKVMARRRRRYLATLAVARAVNNRLTSRKNRPSFEATYWQRVGPDGRLYWMAKSETMTADGKTNWLTRLARTLSWDEYLQTVEESERRSVADAMTAARSTDERERLLDAYDRRRYERVLKNAASDARREQLERDYARGEVPYRLSPEQRLEVLDAFARGENGLPPQFHLTGYRPNDVPSHQIMDLAWVLGETPTLLHLRFGEVRSEQAGAFFGPHYTLFKSRDFPGGERDAGFRQGRIRGDLHWTRHASKKLEKQTILRTRILRARHFGRYVKAELSGASGKAPIAGSSVFADPVVLQTAGAFGNMSRHGHSLQVPPPPDMPPPTRNLARHVDTVTAATGFTPLECAAVLPPPGAFARVPAPGPGALRRYRAAA